MKAMSLLLALALAFAAMPVRAASCLDELKAIDAALPNVKQKSAAQMNEIKRLRAEGEKLYQGGKHAECMAPLGKAKKLLGMK